MLPASVVDSRAITETSDSSSVILGIRRHFGLDSTVMSHYKTILTLTLRYACIIESRVTSYPHSYTTDSSLNIKQVC